MEKVSYNKVRDQIQNGDILLCSGNHPLSRLIREATKSPFSHVAFVMWMNERLMVLESVESVGVRMVPLSFYLSNYSNSGQPYDGELYISRHQKMNELLSQAETKKSSTASLMHKALDLMGKRYGTEDLAKIALRLSLGAGRRDENDAYICSEYVADCFAENGIAFDNLGGFVIPKQIAEDRQVSNLYQISP